MSASVSYWRLPEEESALVEYLDSLEPTVALATHFHTGTESRTWQPLKTAFASGGAAYLIAPTRFLPDMRILQSPDDHGGNNVDIVSSPTLIYARGQMIAPNRLSGSALTADWTHLAEDRRTVERKPEEFVRWAKKVMQWVRKQAPDWHLYKAHRITARADAARRGGLELVF